MISIILCLNLLIQQLFPRCTTFIAQSRDMINRINRKAVPIRTVPDRQLERRINVALLPVSAHEQIVLALTAICQAMHEPGVRMEVEDAWFVICEDGAPFVGAETMGMFVCVDEFEEVDYVDEADLEVWEICA